MYRRVWIMLVWFIMRRKLGVEDLVTFTAAKKLEALIQVRMYSFTHTHNVLIIIII